MPQINIPSIGLVNFPDSMSDEAIAHAIQTNILKSKPPEPPEPSKTESRTGEIVSDIGKSLAATAVTMGTQLPQALFSREKKVTELATAAPYEALNLLGGQTNLLDALRKSYGFKTEEKKEKPTIVSEAQEKFAKPVQEAVAQAYVPGTREFAKLGSDFAKQINNTISPETRAQIEGSVPTWDIAKGELPSLGKAPTMLGYGMQFLTVLESQVPILAAAMRGKNMTERIGNAANMGQRLSAGEGMGEARSYIEKLSDEELAKASPEFVSLSKTMGPKKARDLVTDKAMMDAGVAQGIVGRYGAAFTGHLLNGSFDKFALNAIKNKAGRIALGTAGVGGVQGLEEMAEGLAADIGVNKTVVKEVGANAFANLVFGALGGAPVGAYKGATVKSKTEAPPPQYEQNEQGTFVPIKPTQTPQGSVTIGPIEDAQKQLDLQGGEAPTPKTPFKLAGGPGKYAVEAERRRGPEDVQKTTELRNQFDTIEQELSRIQKAYETEQNPAKRQAMLVQAQKLDFARQEVESQLKAVNVSPRPATPEGQGELFAPEQAPMQPVAPISQNAVQGDLFNQQEAPAKIAPEASPAEQTKQEEIQRQIFALQQGPQSNKVRTQIADLQSQLQKGPGENLDYLKTEYDAIQRALPILEEQRKNTKKLDDKLKITEQINQAKARAEELLKQGAKSAEQLEPTKEAKGLNLSDTINEDHFKEMGINKTNKKIRALLEGKSLSNPDDRAFIVQTLTDYASNPSRSAAVSTKVDNFLNSLKPIQENQNGSDTGANAGAVEPSLPVPREGSIPAEGTATPVPNGMESDIGTTVGLGTGTPPLQNVQSNSLEEPQATQNYGSLYNVNTPSVLQQPNVTMGAIPTSNVVEGEATVSPKQIEVQNDVVHDELTSKEQAQLAVLYGQDEYNDVAKARFIDDFIKAINEGLDKVHRVVANIVRRLQATVLATAIIMNPNYMSPASIALMPVQQQVTTTEQVRAEVPKEVKGMSDGAKKAYSILMPALQDQGKYFTIIDKPSATAYVFNSDGSLVKQSKVLLGKAFGDFYTGGTDFVQNRTTPAGNFVVSAEKGSATYDGKTVYTVGNVDEGWSATIFHTVYTKESDAKDRLAALGKEGPEDSRYSHGCINGSPDLMEAINNGKMDKSHMFVVPDNPELLDSFISNTVPNTDLTRATVEPKTVTKTTTERGQGVSTTGGADQFAIRKEDSMVSTIKKLKKANGFKSLNPSELEMAKELFGGDSDKGIALLRSGFTLDDALKAIGLQRTQKTPTTKEGVEAEKSSEKFNAGFTPPPHKGRFAGIQRKLNAVRQGNLNIGSLIFGNAQNFASNTQAYVNLMRKVMLDMEKSGVLTREQASLAFYRIMGTQATQRATLALQMMKQGSWSYNPKKAWYDTKLDSDVNMDMYDAQVPLLAERLGVDKETALKYIDEALEASRLDGFFKKQAELKKDIATSEQIKAGLEAIKDRTKKEDTQLKSERFILNKLKKDLDRYEKKAMHRTPENVAAGMEHFKYPEVQKAADIWQEMRKRTIKEMVDSGLLTEENAEDWLDEAAYVPFFRDLDLSTEKITQQQIFSKGLRESTAPLRAKQVGSMEKLTSPSTNAKQWMSWALASSVSNRQVNNMIQQYKTFLPDDIKEGNDPKKSSFAVMENGEEKYYNVADADIAQAFIREATYVFPMMAQFKAVSNFGRKAITRNPVFSLTQIPMDLYSALFTSGVNNQLGLVGNVLAEAVKTPFNLSAVRKDMISSGMLNTHDWNAFDDENAAKIASKVKDPSYFARVMNVLEKVGAYSDNVVRQGVATQLMNEGKTREEAYTVAAEIINFRNRSGVTALNSLSQSTMFFNSWLQAVAVTMKTLSGQGLSYQTRAEGLKLLTNNFAKIAAFSFFWAAFQGGEDDEDVYGNKSRKTRDRIFIIPGTEGMAIPIRQDMFAIPHFLAQDAYNVVMDKTYTDPEMVKDSLSDAFKSTFTPPSYGLAQAVKVPLEVGLNKSIYTGQDIVPKYMQTLEPYLQYNQSTGEISKSIGELTNISPLKIEHALKGFTGSLVSILDLFVDSYISKEKGIEKPAQTWREKLAKVPSAGPVVGTEKNMSAISDFYEVKKDVDRLISTYKKLATMDEKKAEEYLAKHENEVVRVKGLEKSFSNLKKYENYILEAKIGTKFDDGTPVTPKSKAEKLKEINKYKNELGESVKEVRKYVYKGF